MNNTLTIKSLASSFVARKMKLNDDQGSGEAKLFVGSTKNQVEYDEFFEFGTDYKYAFNKENLLTYLNQMKLEYMFQMINRYKDVSLKEWNEKYNAVSMLKDDELCITLERFTDTSRYYVRANEDIFKKLFRNLAVPKLTNVVFKKDEDKKQILLTLEINADIENVSEDSTDFADDMREAYRVWLRLQKKENGEALQESYINNLITSFNQLKNKYDGPDFYTISHVDEFVEVRNELQSQTDYDEINVGCGNRALGASLLLYYNFLKSMEKDKVIFKTGYESGFERNRIVFGAPGTGKSFMINEERNLLIGEDNDTDYERVTFHPDYSYANFVGTYKPVMKSYQDKVDLDDSVKEVVKVLKNTTLTAQEKYDLLYERFKGAGLTRLPLLLGLYTDETFTQRKADGMPAVDSSVERNHGRAIRPYVSLDLENNTKEEIAYEYVPGPFMRVLVKALKSAMTDNPQPYLLIIEEINRANVAAVFGDVFQLLDRSDDNCSEYPIEATEDMKKYLSKELNLPEECFNKIRIPDNMFIWATMNSADQGVFPMDTAFKRRWDFTYIGIDDNDADLKGKTVVLGSKEKQKVEWNTLRKAINDFLAKQKINEDKQLGPYFIGRKIVVPENGNEIDSAKFAKVFKNKVIMYLFEDAAKQRRASLFEGCFQNSTRYSEICKEFDEKGIGIFNHDIQIAADPEDIKESEAVEDNKE